MERIQSFTVDHLTLKKGFYLSRQDGDVFTYDLRFCAPYVDDVLSNAALHTLEHLLATVLRNSAIKERIIYVGPMGCQTGFYVLLRDIAFADAKRHILDALTLCAAWEGDIPGNSKQECGNCLTLDLTAAKQAAERFLRNKDTRL